MSHFVTNYIRMESSIAEWKSAPLTYRDSRKSELCKAVDFQSDWYRKWSAKIREEPRMHRKQWEYNYILQALYERGCLKKGHRGLGFAVGTEPLPAVMAGYGCEIVATDLDYEIGRSLGWDSGAQLCHGLNSLNQRGICAEDVFLKKVKFRPVDMNAIPADLNGFDFNWSSCSFEHLGSIRRGVDFLRNQLDTLKPGGWAVHTTEYNISSENETIAEDRNTVIFRRSDISAFVDWAKEEGHYVEPLDFSLGNRPEDFSVDLPPYKPEPHIRLLLSGYVVTSIGLIIRKGGEEKKSGWRRILSAMS